MTDWTTQDWSGIARQTQTLTVHLARGKAPDDLGETIRGLIDPANLPHPGAELEGMPYFSEREEMTEAWLHIMKLLVAALEHTDDPTLHDEACAGLLLHTTSLDWASHRLPNTELMRILLTRERKAPETISLPMITLARLAFPSDQHSTRRIADAVRARLDADSEGAEAFDALITLWPRLHAHGTPNAHTFLQHALHTLIPPDDHLTTRIQQLGQRVRTHAGTTPQATFVVLTTTLMRRERASEDPAMWRALFAQLSAFTGGALDAETETPTGRLTAFTLAWPALLEHLEPERLNAIWADIQPHLPRHPIDDRLDDEAILDTIAEAATRLPPDTRDAIAALLLRVAPPRDDWFPPIQRRMMRLLHLLSEDACAPLLEQWFTLFEIASMWPQWRGEPFAATIQARTMRLYFTTEDLPELMRRIDDVRESAEHPGHLDAFATWPADILDACPVPPTPDLFYALMDLVDGITSPEVEPFVLRVLAQSQHAQLRARLVRWLEPHGTPDALDALRAITAAPGRQSKLHKPAQRAIDAIVQRSGQRGAITESASQQGALTMRADDALPVSTTPDAHDAPLIPASRPDRRVWIAAVCVAALLVVLLALLLP